MADPITLPGNLRHPIAGGLLDDAEGAPVLLGRDAFVLVSLARDFYLVMSPTAKSDSSEDSPWQWASGVGHGDMALDLRRPFGPVVALRWLARALGDVPGICPTWERAPRLDRFGGENVWEMGTEAYTHIFASGSFIQGDRRWLVVPALADIDPTADDADLLALRDACLAAGAP